MISDEEFEYLEAVYGKNVDSRSPGDTLGNAYAFVFVGVLVMLLCGALALLAEYFVLKNVDPVPFIKFLELFGG
jgi:hypothetical protein